jgi:hypothetical protein
MNLTSTLSFRRKLAVGGTALLLAVAGLIAWNRDTGEATAQAAALNSNAAWYASPAGNAEPAARDANAPVVYAPSPFGPEEPVYRTPAAPVAAAAGGAPAHVVAQRPYSHRRHRRVIVKRRPFSHSAAIVAGSAAGGALIGGLAGGGKGAAIGALVGGGGGLVYDRLTHKKKVVVQ